MGHFQLWPLTLSLSDSNVNAHRWKAARCSAPTPTAGLTQTMRDKLMTQAEVQTTTPDVADRDLFALIGEMALADGIVQNMVPGGPVFSEALERSKELDRQIRATRAKTLAGVLWKINETIVLTEDLIDSDWLPAMLVSIRSDLHGMMGRDRASQGLN